MSPISINAIWTNPGWPLDPVLLGVWLTTMGLFGAYNLLQGLLLQEPWRITLWWLILLVLLIELLYYGLLPWVSPALTEAIWPWVASLSIAGISVLTSLFTREFLQLDIVLPRESRWLRGLELLALLLFAGFLLFPQVWVLTAQMLIVLIAATSATLIFWRIWRLGNLSGRLMALGWPALLLGSMVLFLRNLGLLPNEPWVVLVYTLSSAFDAFMVTLALAHELRQIANDSQSALYEAVQVNRAAINRQRNLDAEIRKSRQELAEERARADRLFRSKEAFLSLISHDLRGPLLSVSQAVQLLIEARTKGEAARADRLLTRIDESLSQQVALVNRLLDVEVMRSGPSAAAGRVQNLAIRMLVEKRFAIWRERAAARQVRLDNRIRQDLKIETDLLLINTVLDNLIANALKHCPQGAVVWVEAVPEQPTALVVGNQVGTLNEDQKRAILAATDPQIWNELQRDPVQPGAQGLGLKLAIEVMRANGGNLIPEFGQESVSFCIQLPTTGRQVLLVDDQPLQLELLHESLNRLDPTLSILEAHSVEQAVKILKEEGADLVISDISMPGRDGLELLCLIRADAALEDKPVVLISAVKDQEEAEMRDRQTAILGSDGFYAKPLVNEDLMRILALTG